jgi:hypothetical protein
MKPVPVTLPPVAEPFATSDPGTPSDLLPTSGQVAKAHATFTSVYLIEVPSTTGLRPLDGPIDLTEPLELYDRPAEGVIVTTQQEWLPRAIGLGRLLHSLTLAPGESTRVALVDWSRRVTALTRESTSQVEAVTEEAERRRGIDEVTNATARELQSGSSAATSNTSSTSRGGTAGISTFFWSAGGSASSANSRGIATNVSRTSGSREVTSNTTQHIQDRTQQQATSARDRHAVAVVETSEAESAMASTRVVTNYNHMHALTIEYWEVIQEYELRTWTKRCDRCLFIPMQVVRFNADVFKGSTVATSIGPGVQSRWTRRRPLGPHRHQLRGPLARLGEGRLAGARAGAVDGGLERVDRGERIGPRRRCGRDQDRLVPLEGAQLASSRQQRTGPVEGPTVHVLRPHGRSGVAGRCGRLGGGEPYVGPAGAV